MRDVVGQVVADRRRRPASNGHQFVVDLPEEPLAAQRRPREAPPGLLDPRSTTRSATRRTAARSPSAPQREHDTVEVSVADEGIGIPQADQEQIFRKFYRGADAELRVGAGGTGLGLFIARGLVTAMGGRIWVASREGEGSTFAFELPARGHEGARAE